jgi:hypothetical protein
MSLSTFSSFYFGHTVTSINNSIDFDEGGSELQATLNPGDYSLEEYAEEVKRAMDDAGALTYTVTVARATGFMTIASTSNFTLRTLTGTRFGSSAYPMMGFTIVANFTGTNTYTGTLRSGSVYRPQSLLVDHIASENFVEKTEAVVNESASGRVQVFTFGTTNFIEFTIRLANDYTQPNSQVQIETQASGVANLRAFMNYIVTKAKFEYMPDRAVASTFEKVILETTPASRNGTSYKLEELGSAPGYFSTGKLRLRVVTT